MTGAGAVRVLIVEDDPFAAEIVTRTLSRAGIARAVRHAATEDALLRALDDFRPDLVLSDCNLGDFDGRAALGHVSARDRALPVIMLSGTFRPGECEALLAAGATACVLKDDLAELLAAVREVMPLP